MGSASDPTWWSRVQNGVALELTLELAAQGHPGCPLVLWGLGGAGVTQPWRKRG